MPEKYPTPEQRGYSRLETDNEFRERVIEIKQPQWYIRANMRDMTGERLDDYVWEYFRIQRKRVWV